MTHVTRAVYTRDPDLGNLYIPSAWTALVSRPGAPTKAAMPLGEIGIFTAKQKRPRRNCDGLVEGHDTIWASFTANERLDIGAACQGFLVFGQGSGNAVTASNKFTFIAVANGTLTKTKTDLQLGLGTAPGAGAGANEYTTIGLTRAAGTVSTYTLPASLGATFTQRITKLFSVTGTGTAYGAGIFDSAPGTTSNLYVEDNFASSASLLNGDSLTVNCDISN